MAKYKIGDILVEDRRAYNSRQPFYQERDSTYPLCILRIDEIKDGVEHEGQILTTEETYWMYNSTVDTYTFGLTSTIDVSNTIRIAKDTEIYLYGAGREILEKGE